MVKPEITAAIRRGEAVIAKWQGDGHAFVAPVLAAIIQATALSAIADELAEIRHLLEANKIRATVHLPDNGDPPA